MKGMAKIADLRIRRASAPDCAGMARLINSAFAVEKFIEGGRTDEAELLDRMNKGEFLLGHDGAGELVASVYVEVRGTRGYFGMLAVDPREQGNGLGRKMVAAAEEYCREKGCEAMDLTVLNLRPELSPLYRKLGYAESGVEEFRPSRQLKPGVECHCIVMSKEL
jgi:GNAT superfamily N-acetyltransferase